MSYFHDLIYRIGAKQTAGGGCWITMESCPKNQKQENIFYDTEGATYYNTGNVHFSIIFILVDRLLNALVKYVINFRSLQFIFF